MLLAACGLPVTVEMTFLRPTPEITATPADAGFPEYDEELVTIAEGRAVSIWHVHANNPKAIVVIIPGSDRNKSRYVIGLPIFIPHGYDVILMDYEGFGESTAAPPELERLAEDGLAVVKHALTKHDRVVAFGISAGGPTAVRAAAELHLAAVILEAPAVLETEVEWWLQTHDIDAPQLCRAVNAWVHPQIPESFDLFEHLQDVSEPKLIMQSREDEVIPFTTGYMVYWAAPEPKAFFEMRGHHGKMIELEPELYEQTVINWLDGVLASPS